MRKILLMLLALLFTAGLAITAGAEEEYPDFNYWLHLLPGKYTSGAFEYQILDDGTAAITGYNGTEKELVIPTDLGGGKVTVIGHGAFSSATALRSVTLPDSIREFGERPFGDLPIEFHLPEDHPFLELIDGVLFRKPDKLLIGCLTASLAEHYTIPEGTKTIGYFAFSGHSELQDVTIPQSVTSIKDSAFRECVNLHSLVLPENLKRLPASLCSGCKSLTQVYIPAGVKKLGVDAFWDCLSLGDVYYGGTLKQWDAIYFDQAMPYDFYFPNDWGVENPVSAGQMYFNAVPEDLRKVLEYEGNLYTLTDEGNLIFDACLHAPADGELVIPQRVGGYPVTEIGTFAFSSDSPVTKVIIPEGVRKVRKGAFLRCPAEIVLPSSLEEIGDFAYYRKSWLESMAG